RTGGLRWLGSKRCGGSLLRYVRYSRVPARVEPGYRARDPSEAAGSDGPGTPRHRVGRRRTSGADPRWRDGAAVSCGRSCLAGGDRAGGTGAARASASHPGLGSPVRGDRADMGGERGEVCGRLRRAAEAKSLSASTLEGANRYVEAVLRVAALPAVQGAARAVDRERFGDQTQRRAPGAGETARRVQRRLRRVRRDRGALVSIVPRVVPGGEGAPGAVALRDPRARSVRP